MFFRFGKPNDWRQSVVSDDCRALDAEGVFRCEVKEQINEPAGLVCLVQPKTA
jgi:hypothetical protein